MAKHLAETAFSMGANVDLWMGNATEQIGEWITQENFSSTDDLNKKITKQRSKSTSRRVNAHSKHTCG